MKNTTDANWSPSPVSLRYIAALRGIAPCKAQTAFTYVRVGTFDPESLTCLATSNPEGRFYGFHEDGLLSEKAQDAANQRGLVNVTFGNMTSSVPDDIAFLVCDISSGPRFSDERREQLFDLAQQNVKPGGLFCLRYATAPDEEALTRFVLDALASETAPGDKPKLWDKMETLGKTLFERASRAKDVLDLARANGEFAKGSAASSSFSVMEGLLPREFSYVGDGVVGANYLDLSVEKDAQETLLSFEPSLFYETVKDFALCRLVRQDVWARRPVMQTLDPVALFDAFTFGMPGKDNDDELPLALKTPGGKTVSLKTPLMKALIALMTKMPAGIGDFLSTPAGKLFAPDDVLACVQTLVAAGLAVPMRGRYVVRAAPQSAVATSAKINRFLNAMIVDASFVLVASPVAGAPLRLSAREALVLQAIARAGISNAAGALYQELGALAQRSPALACTLMDHAEPSHEAADALLRTVLEREAPRWYAYGLMAA